MSKRLLAITCMSIVIVCCHAQWKQGEVPPSFRRVKDPTTIDTAQVVAYYAFNATDIKDEKTYIDLGWLQVGKNYTKYASYFMHVSDSTYKPKLIHSGAASGYPRQLNGGKFPDAWSEYQYDELFIKDGQLTEYAVMSVYLDNACCYYTEDYPMQQWKLTDERQTIHGYDCQKATCSWRGRDYTAWFTTEIPVSRGPWKFGGLPGLIVKIYDMKEEYNFELVKLEQMKRPIVQYNFSKFRKTSREQMLQLQKRINVNWLRPISAESASYLPDHPYSPMELE